MYFCEEFFLEMYIDILLLFALLRLKHYMLKRHNLFSWMQIEIKGTLFEIDLRRNLTPQVSQSIFFQ